MSRTHVVISSSLVRFGDLSALLFFFICASLWRDVFTHTITMNGQGRLHPKSLDFLYATFVPGVFLSILLFALLPFFPFLSFRFSVFLFSFFILDLEVTTMSMADRHRLINWLLRETLGECGYLNKIEARFTCRTRLAMEAAPRSIRSLFGEARLCWGVREQGFGSEQLQLRRLVCLQRARPFFCLFIYDTKTGNERRNKKEKKKKTAEGFLKVPSERKFERAFGFC